MIESNSKRITAIKVFVKESAFIMCSVYMPTDTAENFAMFTECLGLLKAIIESSDVESAFVLGDFNAHPTELFGKELMLFCNEHKWLCADMILLGTDSDAYTLIVKLMGVGGGSIIVWLLPLPGNL